MPLEPIRITQDYNNEKGHNGLDLGGECNGWAEGKEKIHNIFKGIVIVSRAYNPNSDDGWGGVVCTASHPNPASEEIITHCNHHIFVGGRFVSACQEVNPGDLIGLEGNTGHSEAAHLHYTVRRWKNLEELQKAIGYVQTSQGGKFTKMTNFFGSAGYGVHNGSHLHGHLDPVGILTHTFDDYVVKNGNPPAYAWSLPYVLNMRKPGIEFGLFDGRYGAGNLVTRREVARWIKIARELDSASNVANFGDLPGNDPDYPYIQALAKFPADLPVIDPKRDCLEAGMPTVCPDINVNRAEALKMIIMAFYGNEYIKLFKDTKRNPKHCPFILRKYRGCGRNRVVRFLCLFWLDEWPCGSQQQLVQPRSASPTREIAKWITMGRNHIFGAYNSACLNTFCPSGQYCDPDTIQCTTLPECVPTTDNPCEIGGGIDENSCNPGDCTPGGNQTAELWQRWNLKPPPATAAAHGERGETVRARVIAPPARQIPAETAAPGPAARTGNGDRVRTRAFANQANSRIKPATAWERKQKPVPVPVTGAAGLNALQSAAPDKPNNSPAPSTDSQEPKKGAVTAAVNGEAGVPASHHVRTPTSHQAASPATTTPRVREIQLCVGTYNKTAGPAGNTESASKVELSVTLSLTSGKMITTQSTTRPTTNPLESPVQTGSHSTSIR
ncbi:MAG: peptidoglycan DD-metalloendopeptidase family protein [Candidatus Gracilibacteria bacterium]